jgi:hypothetical protein
LDAHPAGAAFPRAYPQIHGMKSSEHWRSLLAAPHPGHHLVQATGDPGFRAEAAAHFAVCGLHQEQGVLLIPHRDRLEAILARMRDAGCDIGA